MSIMDEWLDAYHARQAAEQTPAMDDPIAPIGPFSYVRGTRGGPLDVPVQAYRYVHRNATAKRPERDYVKTADTCPHCGNEMPGAVHTACYVEANRGTIGKGTPPAPKRKWKAPRAEPTYGITPERRPATPIPMWLRIMMTPYGEIPCQFARDAWQPTPEAARRIARFT